MAPSLALIVYLPVNKFRNKLALKVPNHIPRNPPFCSFVSFLIVSLTDFINKSDSSRDLIIFMISFISSLEIINVVIPDPNIFLGIAASVADAAAVNHNGTKMFLANGLSTFPISSNAVFSNGPKSLPKILLIVLFHAIEFLIILCSLMNYLQKLYKVY